MKKTELMHYLVTGREIEFTYDEKKYSITYGVDDGEQKICFCEFYQEEDTFCSADDFMERAVVGDERVEDIIGLLTDIVIY